MHEQLTVVNEKIDDLEKRLGAAEVEIASLKAFIKGYFNKPGPGASPLRRDLPVAQEVWERLFGKAGIVKRAAKDQMRIKSRVGGWY